MAIRPEGVDEETDDELEGQGVTAARPNFVASIPAESAYGLRSTPTSRSPSTPPSCTRSTRRRVSRSADLLAQDRNPRKRIPIARRPLRGRFAARVRFDAGFLAALGLSLCCSDRAAGERRHRPCVSETQSLGSRSALGVGAGGARAPAEPQLARVAADLLRHDRSLRERRPGERPRRATGTRGATGLRPGRRRLVPRRRPHGPHRRVHGPAPASRGSRRSASPRSGSRRRSARRPSRARAPRTTATGSGLHALDPHLGTEQTSRPSSSARTGSA